MPQEEAQSLAAAVEQAPVLGSSGEMSFEDAMRSAVEEEAPELELPEAMQEPEGEELVADGAPVPPTVEVVPQGLTEPPAEPEVQNRSLARIMERESQLKARQAEFDSVQPELENLRTRVQAYESAQAGFQRDPTNFIKSIANGADLKRIAEALWYEAQGDAAPQQYLEKKAASHQNNALDERIARIERGEQERQSQQHMDAAQRTMAQYQGSLESFASTADAGSFPLMAAMQGKNPSWVAGTMLEIARHHARATNGQVLTPDQAAVSLERHIASFQVGNTAKNEPKPPEPQGTSLRNNSTQTQPDREPEDELSDDYLRKKAFIAMGRPDLA